MTQDLPWSPRLGKTALRLVASAGDRVLCQDSAQPIRTLWTADGRLVAIGGEALRLDGTPRTAPPAAAHPSPLAGEGGAKAPDEGASKPQQMMLF
jgi:hypothetical protein